ncbi:hypothetical protein [Halorubrum aidingense]|uniref:hypothetical protein n=1 Tax=Halorubrum aidingense TaxID=368623 RepID=UPI001266F79C|nr:hypothetical protein [Halorubrum aidingense]
MIDESDNPEESNGNLPPLREEYTNAKTRLEQQRNVLDSFAKEGRQTLRIILVFVGLLFSAITVVSSLLDPNQIVPSSCGVYLLPSWCVSLFRMLIFSGLGLAISAICHGTIGTEARAIGSVGTSGDIEAVITSEDMDEQAYLLERLSSYQKRIQRNNGVIQFLETVLAMGKIALFIGIIGLTATGVAIISGPIRWYIIPAFIVIFLLLLVFLGRALPDEYLKQDASIRNDSIFMNIFLTENTAKEE